MVGGIWPTMRMMMTDPFTLRDAIISATAGQQVATYELSFKHGKYSSCVLLTVSE